VGDNFEYVTGVFYFNEDNNTDFGDLLDFDLGLRAPPFQPTGNYFPLVLADRVMKNGSDSWAVYAQADYKFLEKWTATLGVRYTDESKDFSISDNQPCLASNPACGFQDVNGDGIADNDLDNVNMDDLNSINPALANIPRKQDMQLVTPRLALQYAVDDQLNFYASATRGFKSGGWNARGTSPDQLIPFQAEKVWSYELGMRSEWFDGQLRANVTAYYMDVSAVQIPTGYTPPSGQVVFITRNYADQKGKGLEAELVATPIDNLTVLLSAGIGDAEFKKLNPVVLQQQQLCLSGTMSACGVGIVTSDGGIADPVRVPDYTVTFGGSYVWALNSTYELIPSAYLYSVGESSTYSAGLPQFIAPAYTTYDASLELANRDQNWSVVAQCKNCNDRTMLVSALANQVYYQDPRTWNISFRKNFGAR